MAVTVAVGFVVVSSDRCAIYSDFFFFVIKPVPQR